MINARVFPVDDDILILKSNIVHSDSAQHANMLAITIQATRIDIKIKKVSCMKEF